MRPTFFKRFFLVFALCIFTLSAYGKMKIITAVNDAWPPYVTRDNARPGFSVEVVTAALHTQGYDIEFLLFPWARGLHEVRNARIDLITTTWYTDARSEYLVYSDPYFATNIDIMMRKDTIFDYNGPKSLTGKRIASVRDYGYDQWFLDAEYFQRVETTSLMSSLQMLAADRIDIAIGNRFVMLQELKPLNLDADDFHFSPTPMIKKHIHVTAAKANPNASKYIQAFNRGLEIIKQNGTFDDLKKKYRLILPDDTTAE
ncbi:transporter substrate-binding domain-containing protein [Salinivibrio kushneri]|uniref:transporter substrate-binding domain-containing protein n=1 Tax=Salinivibrio kushneri TaxID=1908198 RepID=UPI000988FC7E|nr:transporter substrate-binding domain-containing protein [Salinivibrio kushneri]